MKHTNPDTHCDLLIIGTGLTGMAAALFAAKAGIDTVQVGHVGQLGFASGLIDLLGVHPVAEGRWVSRPYEAMAGLRSETPDHPYAKLGDNEIQTALETVLFFLEARGYPHFCRPGKNLAMLTPAGTVKPTYAVPHTMAHAAEAWAHKTSALLVDFKGLKGFSARQIAAGLNSRWPELRPLSLDFPDSTGELYAESLARRLDMPQWREKLVATLRPHIGEAEAVGLPAVLGLYRSSGVIADLRGGLGVPVFEVPTMLPAVAGLRVREIFEQQLPDLGIRPFYHQSVCAVERKAAGGWVLSLAEKVGGAAMGGQEGGARRIHARSVLLCSGRFFGKGLHAERRGIRETVFDLPVVQPPAREFWHQKDFFAPEGHAVNRAGLAVDGDFRPLGRNGAPAWPDLFSAGIILAHQDWMREKCGSGLAIATAYGAVRACARFLRTGPEA